MSIKDITPEQNLVTLLTGHVSVGKTSKAVPVYRRGSIPTTNNAEDFIVVEQNGGVQTYTEHFESLTGFLMVSYYTKLNSDGTIRYSRIDKIMDQIETACVDVADAKYFYELQRSNPVTPPTANQDVGYSYVRVNIRWHTK